MALSATSWTPPGMVTPPPAGAAHSNTNHPFCEELFPDAPPKPPLKHPKTESSCPALPCFTCNQINETNVTSVVFRAPH